MLFSLRCIQPGLENLCSIHPIDAFLFALGESNFKRPENVQNDVVLKIDNIFGLPIVALTPNAVLTLLGVD